jgi:uroporphyrinogen-III synthase
LTLPEHADNSPLAGRRIVVTRAPEQSQELFDCLRDAGAKTLLLPMVHFLDPVDTDTDALDQAIVALDEFDWLVLMSANAVQFFLARCRKLDRWPRGGKPKIATVGPATRAALEVAGLRAAFMPQAFNGAALAAELAPHLPGQHVLLPRSNRAAADLPAALRGAGAIVTEVVAYRTAAPESMDRSLLDAICHGEVDAVIFFSPSAVEQFVAAMGSETLEQIGERMALAAVGPVTASALLAAGALAVVEAPAATAASVVAALERHFICVGSK